MKNRKNYVMTKSNLTLTQSGLLAVLLQRQRHKVIELALRPAHRRQVQAPFWGSLTRRWAHYDTNAGRRFRQALCGNRSAAHLNLSPKQIAMSHQIHTYTELRKQIHDDLPIQHPEWVEPNGESLMWLTKLLDSLTQTGIQRVYRYSSSRLRTGTKPGSTAGRCNTSGGKQYRIDHNPSSQ